MIYLFILHFFLRMNLVQRNIEVPARRRLPTSVSRLDTVNTIMNRRTKQEQTKDDERKTKDDCGTMTYEDLLDGVQDIEPTPSRV